MALVPVATCRFHVLVPAGAPAFQGEFVPFSGIHCQEHWEVYGVRVGLDGSKEVPGLILRVLKSTHPGASSDFMDIAHTLITVTNSFTAVIRLVLLPGSDMIKVSVCGVLV